MPYLFPATLFKFQIWLMKVIRMYVHHDQAWRYIYTAHTLLHSDEEL